MRRTLFTVRSPSRSAGCSGPDPASPADDGTDLASPLGWHVSPLMRRPGTATDLRGPGAPRWRKSARAGYVALHDRRSDPMSPWPSSRPCWRSSWSSRSCPAQAARSGERGTRRHAHPPIRDSRSFRRAATQTSQSRWQLPTLRSTRHGPTLRPRRRRGSAAGARTRVGRQPGRLRRMRPRHRVRPRRRADARPDLRGPRSRRPDPSAGDSVLRRPKAGRSARFRPGPRSAVLVRCHGLATRAIDVRVDAVVRRACRRRRPSTGHRRSWIDPRGDGHDRWVRLRRRRRVQVAEQLDELGVELRPGVPAQLGDRVRRGDIARL